MFKCEWCGAQIVENGENVSQGCAHHLKNCLSADVFEKNGNNFIDYDVWIQCANVLGYETVSDWLYCAYDEMGITIPELSNISGISENALMRKIYLFCNHGRKIDWMQKAVLSGYPDEKTWLFTEYTKNQKTIMEIAGDANISYSSIRKRIKLYCILRKRIKVDMGTSGKVTKYLVGRLSDPKESDTIFVDRNIKAILEKILSEKLKDTENDPLYKWFLEHSEWFSDPENLDIMVISEFREIVSECAKKLLCTNDWLTIAIYTDYCFFDNMLSKLCEKFYGSMYCADRARNIIKCALSNRKTGELLAFDSDSNYWEPPTGTPEQWYDLVYSIGRLKYGHPEEFFGAYHKLTITL